MSHRRLLLLAAAVTDATSERSTLDGQVLWVGRGRMAARLAAVMPKPLR